MRFLLDENANANRLERILTYVLYANTKHRLKCTQFQFENATHFKHTEG